MAAMASGQVYTFYEISSPVTEDKQGTSENLKISGERLPK